MPNEEVLGPRKTMFVLVIVVGCFAMLWPRILSPLLLGNTRDQLKPNQFDRDAGCCEVMFGTELTALELINEVCSSAVHVNGKLSPYAAAECRKAVNETCGVDIADFLKRSDNIGKSSRLLVQTMQRSNSSCLKQHFGVPLVDLGPHAVLNSWTVQDKIKQERPPVRSSGQHAAMRERGRAIPASDQTPSKSNHVQMPPNVRVRTSPLVGYFELDIKPPPIPGMRPPLGSAGGPITTPKSSMGFVMPIYTICIIVFFVYTICKLLFKRATIPYEPVPPDPLFRRRVFRDESRSSPEKLVVTAISGLVAEVQQQMEAGYAQNQQRQEPQDNHARPYTNGTIIHNSGPVHIIASQYQEAKGTTPEPTEPSDLKEPSPEPELREIKETTPDDIISKTSLEEPVNNVTDIQSTENIVDVPESDDLVNKNESHEDETESDTKANSDQKTKSEGISDLTAEAEVRAEPEEKEFKQPDKVESNHKEPNLINEHIDLKKNGDVISRVTEDFLKEEAKTDENRKELLKEVLEEDGSEDGVEQENASVKVMGMEVTAHRTDGGAYIPLAPAPPPVPASPASPARAPHSAEDVKSIFLETSIPQQSRVLVADFAENRPDSPDHRKHSPMVVSGKMTLSLIQDAPRDTPEREAESTVDDFTTASGLTQNVADVLPEDESDEEILEEIEIEEVEEESGEEDEDLEEEEEEEDEEDDEEEREPDPPGNPTVVEKGRD